MLALCEVRNYISFVGLVSPRRASESRKANQHPDGRTGAQAKSSRSGRSPFSFPTNPGLWLHLLIRSAEVAFYGGGASFTHAAAVPRQREAYSYQPVILKSL